MPTPGDQIPGGTQQMARDIAELKRQVRELRAARRLENASVGKGGMKIVSGGRLSMDTPSGVRMVDNGQINNTDYNHSDGSTQQAMFHKREDGSLMFACFSYPPLGSETQAWKWFDRTGNVVFAEDTNSGMGLARPYLPVPMGPGYDGGWDYWPRAASTSTSQLWSGRFYKQLPNIVVVVKASMDTSGGNGTIELTVGGTVQGTAQNLGFSVGYITLGPYSLASYDHMQQVDIVVQGRRTSGTGALRASLYSAYQV